MSGAARLFVLQAGPRRIIIQLDRSGIILIASQELERVLIAANEELRAAREAGSLVVVSVDWDNVAAVVQTSAGGGGRAPPTVVCCTRLVSRVLDLDVGDGLEPLPLTHGDTERLELDKLYRLSADGSSVVLIGSLHDFQCPMQIAAAATTSRAPAPRPGIRPAPSESEAEAPPADEGDASGGKGGSGSGQRRVRAVPLAAAMQVDEGLPAAPPSQTPQAGGDLPIVSKHLRPFGQLSIPLLQVLSYELPHDATLPAEVVVGGLRWDDHGGERRASWTTQSLTRARAAIQVTRSGASLALCPRAGVDGPVRELVVDYLDPNLARRVGPVIVLADTVRTAESRRRAAASGAAAARAAAALARQAPPSSAEPLPVELILMKMVSVTARDLRTAPPDHEIDAKSGGRKFKLKPGTRGKWRPSDKKSSSVDFVPEDPGLAAFIADGGIASVSLAALTEGSRARIAAASGRPLCSGATAGIGRGGAAGLAARRAAQPAPTFGVGVVFPNDRAAAEWLVRFWTQVQLANLERSEDTYRRNGSIRAQAGKLARGERAKA